MNLDFIYNGGTSKRYHTVDTLRTQDIAAHSFGVAWLCELLTSGAASKHLIMAALAHDLAEHMVGDIPSPSKRKLEVSGIFDNYEGSLLVEHGVGHYKAELTETEKDVLKAADAIDGMLFCLRERTLGNRNVEIVYGRFREYANECGDFFLTKQKMMKAINDKWMEVTNGR